MSRLIPSRLGRYEVEIPLDAGGQGLVLLAHDPLLGRQVAIKVIRPDVALPPDAAARLTDAVLKQASAAATLSHPGIAMLLDAGEAPPIGVFLVFELVSGTTLRDRLARGPLPRGEVIELARKLGSALGLAHSAGLVHGNVRPECILFSASGPKLIEAAFPRIAAAPELATALPQSPYLAPELTRSDEVLTASGDQFALAAVIHEALTGLRPPPWPPRNLSSGARGDANEIPPRSSPPSRAPQLTSAVDVVLGCALSEDPLRRFPSCEAFGIALAESLEPTKSAHVTSFPLTSMLPQGSIVPRATRRRQNTIVVLALLAILALVLLGRTKAGTDPRTPKSAEPAGSARKPTSRHAPGAGAD
jgi:serine/threonine-protein kinase